MAALGLRAVLMGPLRHDVNGDARVGCAEPGDSLRVEPVVVGELSDGLLVGARRERRGRDAEDGEWQGGGSKGRRQPQTPVPVISVNALAFTVISVKRARGAISARGAFAVPHGVASAQRGASSAR